MTRNAKIELPDFVTEDRVERAHRRAAILQRDRRHDLFDQGIRAAKAQDPKLLLGLEKIANLLDHKSERQAGMTRRSNHEDTPEGHKVQFTEVAMWQEAYRLADAGGMTKDDLYPFGWLYAAAAEMVGITA